MHHRIGLATRCLHISAVLYLGVGLIVMVNSFFFDERGNNLIRTTGAIVLLLVCLALVVGIAFVNAGLRRRRFWAWVAALCIFGMYLPSLFLPLGALGLWGLLDPGSRAEFGIGVNQEPRTG